MCFTLGGEVASACLEIGCGFPLRGQASGGSEGKIVGKTSPLSGWRVSALVAAAMLVFALDLAVPVLVVQVLYIPLIILAAWSLPPLATWLYFVFCAVMAVYDVEYESQLLANNQLWIRIANEVILACCGAVITGLALSSRRHGKQLNETYRVLRGSEEQLRHFVEQVPAAVAMFDQEMRYLAHSRRWVTDLHIPPENIIGRHHYEDLPNFPQRWKDDHRRALQGEVVRRNDEFFCEFNGRTEPSAGQCPSVPLA